MKNYLALAPRYLKVHSKKMHLLILSVAMSVALITGIFSMFDVFMQFEKQQIIHDYGNFHFAIEEASNKEISYIKNRIDVENYGKFTIFPDGIINNLPCKLAALDENFSENMNIEVIKGKYPVKENEIMLEEWVAKNVNFNLDIGDSLEIFLGDKREEVVVSGIYNDLGNTKAEGIPGIFLSTSAIKKFTPEKNLYLVQFKEKVNINKSIFKIKEGLNFQDDRVHLNDRLIAVIGQSRDKSVIGLYTVGAVLFAIVLLASVVMMYNTFNISVMERIRQFGLLRCVGASSRQIRKLVKREGLTLAIKAIPLGLLAGILMTFLCSAILKFYNNSYFGDIPLFSISLIGISMGTVIGFLTVVIASFIPAHKAGKISPLNAVKGNDNLKIIKSKKKGFLTRIFPVEIALGINNAFLKKKTLFWMSCSIAISIIIFLGFNVFVDFMHSSLKTTKPYTPDISLVSEKGIDQNLLNKISKVEGVKKVYGRMFGYVDAPQKSWLISYDQNQLKWAKPDLISGELSKDKMNKKNGVIVVDRNLHHGIQTENTNFNVGDKVYINTPLGIKEMTVLGVLNSVPFNNNEVTSATFITTEELFTSLTGKSHFDILDIQLEDKHDEKVVEEIKSNIDKSISFQDQRQQNAEINQTFFTMAVFIYGFVGVIALISILNVINTMNTSVANKIRYLGVVRAVGMSGRQLKKMLLSEALTYVLFGCFFGSSLGIMLHKYLIENGFTNFKVVWHFPLAETILIVSVTLFSTILSIRGPLKRIKAKGISEVINSL